MSIEDKTVTDELAAFEEWAAIKYPNASRRDSLGAFSRDLKKAAQEGWKARALLIMNNQDIGDE